jgi:hypothetical protein
MSIVQGLSQRVSDIRKSHEKHTDPMLSYFLGTLDVRLRRIAPLMTGGADPVKDGALDEIKRALNAFPATFGTDYDEDTAWGEANRIERLFALILPADSLWEELKRRLADAVDEGVGSAARLQSTALDLKQVVMDPQNPGQLRTTGEAAVRSLLLETLEETHWTVQRKFYSRPIRKSATTRIVCFGMFAFILFIAPFGALYLSLWRGKPDAELLGSWAMLPLYAAATTGLFGALFSRLLYLQSNWDAMTIGGLKDAREFTSIILRGCVGMIGAVIVFFFLKSGVVSGGLFPDFAGVGVEEVKITDKVGTASMTPLHLYYPSKDWALLVVWSFLAGFSERLVPSILQDTETTIRQQALK